MIGATPIERLRADLEDFESTKRAMAEAIAALAEHPTDHFLAETYLVISAAMEKERAE